MAYTDPERQRAYQREWLRRRRDAWITENGPCSDCETWDNLEVDHVDRTEKVSHSVWSWSKKRREAELYKCQTLCKSCHAKKTAADQEPPHGTNGRYTSKNWRCRCQDCRDAHAVINSKYR